MLLFRLFKLATYEVFCYKFELAALI